MYWIYESPLYKKDELEVRRFIEQKTKSKTIAEKATKVLSLRKFLYTQKFESADDLQNSVFYDAEKTRPVFDKKSAKEVYDRLKQKGGKEHELTDQAVRTTIGYLQTYLPEPLQNFTNNIYN